jgi:hypothetical protein
MPGTIDSALQDIHVIGFCKSSNTIPLCEVSVPSSCVLPPALLPLDNKGPADCCLKIPAPVLQYSQPDLMGEGSVTGFTTMSVCLLITPH